ncbi:MAG: ATPase, T2SS/T4P/T4SS family [Bdellovibrionales bacterium]|jgi:twitching motility protein PilT
MPTSLGNLPFIDLYVCLEKTEKAYFRSKDRTQSIASQFVPPEYQDVINRFVDAINLKLQEKNDGALTFDGIRCRLARQQVSDGSHWVCARRIETEIPDIDKLNLPPVIVNHMKGLGRRDGLIVISGATGHGKTTTAVALLEHYLKNYGGTAVTIEDPCEYIMAGRHGTSGQCFQIEVMEEEDWAICLKRTLRWSPRYIFVGEIRTPKAAEQLLRAASTGHLVITTVHSGTMEEALMGIIFLAEQSMGSGVYNMLASGLTALVNQTLGDSKPNLKYLFTEENNNGDPVRTLIREAKTGMLATYIDRTAARLQAGALQNGSVTGGKKT